MHFVFAAHGTWGDVGPMAEVAEVLQRRGARVTFISTPFFAEGLNARGLAVTTVGPHWNPEEGITDARLRHPLTGPVNIWRLIFGPLVSPFFEASAQALERERGVVVAHPWCLGAQLAAEAKQCPWALVSLAPVTWFSAEDPPVAGPFSLPTWFSRALIRGPVRLLLKTVFGETLHEEAARRGLPKRNERFFFAMQHAAANLAFWPDCFRSPVDDDPPRATLCGFSLRASLDDNLGEPIERFLREGPAPVIMGLGSALPAIAPEVYEIVDSVLDELELRAILVGAPDKTWRRHTLRVDRAPYGPLFARARLTVHHGGIGTTAEALAAGRPQLVIPFGADQYDNAARLVRLGVARTVVKNQVSAVRIRRAIVDLLTHEKQLLVQTVQLSHSVRAAKPGVEVAAEALVAVGSAKHLAWRA